MPSPSVLLHAWLSRVRLPQPLVDRDIALSATAAATSPGVRDPKRGPLPAAEGLQTADSLAEAD
jgi:hypothetical protein